MTHASIEQQVAAAWNAQADEFNQWSELDLGEKIEWAAKWGASQARMPLSAEEIWDIERNSYVASRRPEYTTDCFGEDKTVWHETSNFSFLLFARNIEAAHGITHEKHYGK